jgi:hypothetical protein
MQILNLKKKRPSSARANIQEERLNILQKSIDQNTLPI